MSKKEMKSKTIDCSLGPDNGWGFKRMLRSFVYPQDRR